MPPGLWVNMDSACNAQDGESPPACAEEQAAWTHFVTNVKVLVFLL